ncbi:MAG: hypothetical protein LWW85_03985, partial [Marinilabiliales bacterium]|nr:hypothetical protein [Marinilabiliales bacterium]
RTNKITMQDGLVLSNEINNPSSVEGFAMIPVNIAKAIVSIPTQLVQFKFDNTTKLEALEKEKLNYEKALRENEKYLYTRQQELEKVKLDLEKARLTNASDLEKYQMELQTGLATAEKNLITVQKELAELKKQMEDLRNKK